MLMACLPTIRRSFAISPNSQIEADAAKNGRRINSSLVVCSGHGIYGSLRIPLLAVCDARAMTKGRLEAFTDAVIAIIMTIMVLDLRPPAGHGFGDLKPVIPKLLVYTLSFTFLAIYWNNHHHLMHVVERIDSRVLWANMGLLFSLSLTPAATAWLGEHRGTPLRSWRMGWSCWLRLLRISYSRGPYSLCTHGIPRWPSPSGAIAKVASRRSRT